ncbi:hypothetical protein CDAR_48301 [Caerostris darwini]|uniref:Uncharacterized protein n=1 Tax=Caerostris darwini TaxID=1538125 RepID=A0AAV4W2W0_9ARAC|nr:hypothetical protein CDAR_48301 [Caerostris darwini]
MLMLLSKKEIIRCVWIRCIDNANKFAKFRSGNFNGEDAPLSGKPVEDNEGKMKTLFDANRRITNHEITKRLFLQNTTIYDHVKSLV